MPWERDRLTPVEIETLYEGLRWRRSRDIEVLTKLLEWFVSCHTSDLDFDKLIDSMPNYDRGHQKQIEGMRDRALKKMKSKRG